eukprot:193810_1
MFVLILSVIIVTVNAQDIQCRNYQECANDTNITTPSNQYDIRCEGSFSCASTSAMLTGDNIDCYGSRACVSIPSIQYVAEGKGWSYCDGLESCADSVFTMKILHCYGSKACIGTTITAATEVRGYGAYSLQNASIIAVNKNITISLYGHYACYGCTIQCNGTSQCAIICAGTACANLNIIGSGVWNVSYLSQDTIRTNVTNDGTVDAIKNDQECTQSFDIFQERWQASNIISNETGAVCCRGQESCRDIGMISMGNNTLFCSGSYSCSDAKIEG